MATQYQVVQLNLALPALRDLVLARRRLPRRDPGGLVHKVPEIIKPNLGKAEFNALERT